MNKKKIILDFIKKHKICVLSTISQNKSESAVIEFGETEDLELIFDTFNTYRKYQNIQKNHNVSVVIGWDKNITVQYEGQAIELLGKELDKYKKIYFAKNPNAQRWEKFTETKHFKVVPTWIRYSDLRKQPWDVFEVKF